MEKINFQDRKESHAQTDSSLDVNKQLEAVSDGDDQQSTQMRATFHLMDSIHKLAVAPEEQLHFKKQTKVTLKLDENQLYKQKERKQKNLGSPRSLLNPNSDLASLKVTKNFRLQNVPTSSYGNQKKDRRNIKYNSQVKMPSIDSKTIYGKFMLEQPSRISEYQKKNVFNKSSRKPFQRSSIDEPKTSLIDSKMILFQSAN